MLLFIDSGASAGGARAKAVIGWNRQLNKIVSGAGKLTSNFEHWLIKFDDYDEAHRVVRFITKDIRSLEEFYKRTLFNVIARNQDDHAKNTSFLMSEDGEWTLSPAYDITYANGAGFTKNHQMSIMGKVNDFTRTDLLLAKSNDIKQTKANEIIDLTIEIVSTFRKRAEKLRMREDLIMLVEKDLRIYI